MLRSMTAYGRGTIQESLGRFVVEMQSVNKKFLDVQVQVPSELCRYELEIKKWIGARLARGAVIVRVFAEFEGRVPVVVKANLPLVRQLKDVWQQIVREFGGDPSQPLPVSLLAQQEDVLLYSEEVADEEAYRKVLSCAVAGALEQLIAMREREGALLQQDIAQRLEALRVALDKIEVLAGGIVSAYRKKLEERLQEFSRTIDNEERILREICLYADKVDIAEEITRLRSHMEHFQKVLEGDKEAGKTLEFVIQEMGREVNTMGSKSSDSETSRLVVDMKGELERIREQVQNVE